MNRPKMYQTWTHRAGFDCDWYDGAVDVVVETTTLRYSNAGGLIAKAAIDLPDGYRVLADEGVVLGDGSVLGHR